MVEHLVVDWICSPVFNFSMHQNHVPSILQIKLTNQSEESLHQIKLEIKSNPELTLEWSQTIDTILPEQTIQISPKQLQFDVKQLALLTEKLSTSFQLFASIGDETKMLVSNTVDILTFDEWAGILVLPEMLAAFCTPNHPDISKVVGNALPYLEKWTASHGFTAYQTQDVNVVKYQTAALYSALQELEINYIEAQPSYEQYGQRIRSYEQMLDDKFGNCLEMTLLYAACVEYIGLNPVIVIVKGHAFLAVWLEDQMLSDAVTDDLSAITKRIASGINKLLVIEPTALCKGMNLSFEHAIKQAEANLLKEDNFELALDIKRARAALVKPLPSRMTIRNAESFDWEMQETNLVRGNQSNEPTLLNTIMVNESDSKTWTKQQYWERKLLDLTLRNSLINFRMNRSAIPLMTHQLNELEDSLASGKEFQILARPADWDNHFRSEALANDEYRKSPLIPLITAEFTQNRLRSSLAEQDLQQKLTTIYRASKKSLEENGANTLYVAFGLLKWLENKHSTVTRYAPLILIPIDIVRRSSALGYVIRMREEEAQFNVTLVELLKQDFKLNIDNLDPLPKDEQGIDVNLVFHTVRHAIMNMPKWDIDESAYIGLFSFGQFVMWNDLRQYSHKLSENKIVASLMDQKLKLQIEDTAHVELDSISAKELLLPISADSSQRYAIYEALNGKSFVLHGPPGTGKSQTITNMIASLLGQGKRVLFVAEKRAALEVVEERLKKIGLDPFCLELHSNKATKRTVLNQLEQTILHTKQQAPEQWLAKVEQLQAMINDLNGFVKAMHKRRHYGLTLYDTIIRYEASYNGKLGFMLTKSQYDELTEEQITQWLELVKQLQIAAQTIGTPYQHELSGIQIGVFTVSDKDRMVTLIDKGLPLLAQLKEAIQENALSQSLAMTAFCTKQQLEAYIALLNLADQMPKLAMMMLLHHDYAMLNQNLAAVVELQEQLLKLEEELTPIADLNKLLLVDIDALALQWQQSESKWFLGKLLSQRSIKKMLSLYMLDAKKAKQQLNLALLLKLKQWKLTKQSYDEAVQPLLTCMSKETFTISRPAYEALLESKEWYAQLQQEVSNWELLYVTLVGNWKATLKTIQLDDEKRHNVSHIRLQYNNLLTTLNELSSLLSFDFHHAVQLKKESYIDQLTLLLQLWSTNREAIKDFAVYNHMKQLLCDIKLDLLVDLLQRNELPTANLTESFERGLYRSIISFCSSEDDALKSFNRELFEEKLLRFKSTDQQVAELTKLEIVARLSSQVPNMTFEASQNSEAGILQRAIRNGGRQLSIRKMIEQIPHLFARLAPCMLMSPISVAQYLNADTSTFDVIIFDEASQVATAEAVGALARGTQAIVVGDPKQLPPTSFFSKNNDEEDAEEDLSDLESILDDCLAVGMPQLYLAWHYRSKHESLIAFSNAHYYDHKLLTFPSPNEPVSKVTLKLVDGYYDRGKTKHNRKEAEEIIAAIIDHVKLKKDSRSLGIVTFSSIQQGLIEDLLDEACGRDAELERLLGLLHEPIFIKNLENVQGDERDVILFSVGYGPDLKGKVTMNFGPLNREGGWRRLNVAVSRARYEMQVYSTMQSSHISPNRVKAKGVIGLRSFLEYAEKGKHSLPLEMAESEIAIPSALHTAIARELELAGYKCDMLVGTSQFKVDLAVYHPNNPNQYVFGLLLDGPIYSSAATARDRDVLRNSVLLSLGWRIHYVWAMEWFEQKEKTMQHLLKAIKEEIERVETSAEAKTARFEASIPAPPFVTASTVNEQVVLSSAHTFQSEHQLTYYAAQLDSVEQAQFDFYSVEGKRIIRKQINTVLGTEAPIVHSLLVKRIIQAWGFSRTGTRIEQQLQEVIASTTSVTNYMGQFVYWGAELKQTEYVDYREASDNELRASHEWPVIELANLLRELIQLQISLPQAELFKQAAKQLGHTRVPQQFEPLLYSAVESLIEQQQILRDELERLIWKG